MSQSPVIQIGLCGFGTVGQGVWQHIAANRERLESRLGARLEITRVAARDLGKARDVELPAGVLGADPLAIARDPAIGIVCELMGGTGIAREVTLEALRRGKVVVSANKALICEHGPEVFETARKHGGHFFFEASVAGGIPIIKALREGLVANRFTLIYGILNGTCNYILTRMQREGLSYPAILADAKRLGYAEADESLDVEGWDTAHKAAVLTYLAHGLWVGTDRMLVEGITAITQADIRRTEALGFTIKLLAVISRDFSRNEVTVRVHPTLVPRQHVLANVNEVFNGISVAGDVAGTTFYIGRGAGRDATASAVISDIVDAATLLLRGPSPAAPTAEVAAPRSCAEIPAIADVSGVSSRFYVRLTVADAPGVLAQVAGVLAREGISISSVLQEPSQETPSAAELFLTTHLTTEGAMRAALASLKGNSSVVGSPLVLRIGDW